MTRVPLLLSGAALVLGACNVREDLSDCPPAQMYNTRLAVITDLEQQRGRSRGPADYEWYNNQIESVTVYAFDSDDNFAGYWSGGAYRLGAAYLVPMNLEQDGTYHFVAWTNSGEIYAPSHAPESLEGRTRGELMMNFNVPENDVLSTDIPHRHYGELDNALILTDRNNSHTIVISPQTYKVNFIVRGLSTDAGLYEVDVTDRNSQHTFDAEHIDGLNTYTHLRPLARNAENQNEITASMILLQIGDDTKTSFDILDTQAEDPLYTDDLLETIQRAYPKDKLEEMLEDHYEYDIIITFTGGGEGGALKPEVEVKAWGYVPNPIHL